MNVRAKVSRYSALPARPSKRSDHEFLAPALEVLETPPSPIRMYLILVICAFVTVALVWSYFGQIDIIAAAQGKIQPVGRVKVVQPLVTGKVVKLPPQNGTVVKTGETLLELDPTDALADEREASRSLNSVLAEIDRRDAAVEYVRSHTLLTTAPVISWDAGVDLELRRREDAALEGDLNQHYAAVASLRAQKHQKEIQQEQLESTLVAQRSLVATLKERVDMRSGLAVKQAGTLASVMDATESLKEQSTQLAVQEGQLADAQASVDVIAREIDRTTSTFLNDQITKIADGKKRADELEQRLAKARNVLDQMTLKSPFDGVTQGSSITSIGQVVTVGQDLMKIVPEHAELELEVYMPNKDIGFIRVGQEAVVKLDAFPFTRYGTVPAEVTKVAADAIPEPDAARREGDGTARQSETLFGGAERTQNLVFPVTLKLIASEVAADGDKVRLAPGMAATAEVVTGRRRILEYVFSPLLQITEEALHER